MIHYTVFFVRKFEGVLKKDSKIVTTRSMKIFDKDACLTDVAEIGWEQGLNETDDVDILVTYWSFLFPLLLTSMLISSPFGFPKGTANFKTLKHSRDMIKRAAIKTSHHFL